MSESRLDHTEESGDLLTYSGVLSFIRSEFVSQTHSEIPSICSLLDPPDSLIEPLQEEMALQVASIANGEQLQDSVGFFKQKVTFFFRKWQGRRDDWASLLPSEEFFGDVMAVILATSFLSARLKRERDSAGTEELLRFFERLMVPDLDGCLRDWPELSILLWRVAADSPEVTRRTRPIWSPEILSHLRQNQKILADMMNESEDGEVSIEDLASRCGFDSPDDNTNGLVRRFNVKLGSIGEPQGCTATTAKSGSSGRTKKVRNDPRTTHLRPRIDRSRSRTIPASHPCALGSTSCLLLPLPRRHLIDPSPSVASSARTSSLSQRLAPRSRESPADASGPTSRRCTVGSTAASTGSALRPSASAASGSPAVRRSRDSPSRGASDHGPADPAPTCGVTGPPAAP